VFWGQEGFIAAN